MAAGRRRRTHAQQWRRTGTIAVAFARPSARRCAPLGACRVYDEVYSKADVEELVADAQREVKERVRRDMETTISMAALVIEQMYLEAEAAGVTVRLDLLRTEDEGTCTRMLECACHTRGAPRSRRPPPP
jgi:hypothetical protein